MTWSRRRWLSSQLHVGGWGAALACGLGGCRPAHDTARAGTGTPATLPPTGGWADDDHLSAHAWRDGHIPRPDVGVPTRPTDVAIVGAGVAGLAAARALQQQGVNDCHLFEWADQPGGNARAHTMMGLPCPSGAHYLPVPDDRPSLAPLRHLLEDLGLLHHVAGRWMPEQRHVCHAPQERIWVGTHWQEGWLPETPEARHASHIEAQQFAHRLEAVSRMGFTVPTSHAPWTPAHAALDTMTFAQWLRQENLTDPWLLSHLDYVCRDDFGAGLPAVSAWAGLQYFASRHGFHLPQASEQAREHEDTPLFTWPQGNAWLTERMAAPFNDRISTHTAVTRVDVNRRHITLETWNPLTGHVARWQARQVILCTPLFVTARLLRSAEPGLVDALRSATAHLQYAPWLVSNLHLRAPLIDRIGSPAMAWDNVPLRPTNTAASQLPPSLGYVNAAHQSLHPAPPAGVLTHYWALGADQPAVNAHRRQALLQAPWQFWAQHVMADLSALHPDLSAQCDDIRLHRWGHAMVIPRPGTRGHPALQALQMPWGRVHLGHADLSAYSVFEEAFHQGLRAGRSAAQAIHTAP